MRTIFATHYRVDKHVDSDYGMHQADGGYSIAVSPLAKGVDFTGGVAVQDVTCRIAAERLGYSAPFINAGELYEACEDGDESAIAVAETAKNIIRPTMFEMVEIVLTPDQVSEIDAAYPGRENRDFNKVSKGWVKKASSQPPQSANARRWAGYLQKK